jgi:hypothetical protein
MSRALLHLCNGVHTLMLYGSHSTDPNDVLTDYVRNRYYWLDELTTDAAHLAQDLTTLRYAMDSNQ